MVLRNFYCQKLAEFLTHAKNFVFASRRKIVADKNFVFVASKLKILTDFSGVQIEGFACFQNIVLFGFL
jgi:hypothetical protein